MRLPMLPDFLVSALTQYGSFLPRWLASTFIGFLAAILLDFGFELSPETIAKFSTLLTVAIAGAWGEYLKRRNEQGVKQIQAELQTTFPNVDIDGVATPGGITVGAAKKVVEVMDKVTSGEIASTETSRAVTQELKP